MSELFDKELHEDVVKFKSMVKSDIEDHQFSVIEIDSVDDLLDLPETDIEALCEYPSITSKEGVESSEIAEDIRDGKTKFKKDHGINPHRYQVHVRTMPESNRLGDIFIQPDRKGPDALNRPRTGVVVNVGPKVHRRKVGEEVIYPEKFGVKYPGIENPYGQVPGLDCEIREIDVHRRITNIIGKYIPGTIQPPTVLPVQLKGESEPKERKIIDVTSMYGGMVKVDLGRLVSYEDSMGRAKQTSSIWVLEDRVKYE